MAGPFGLLPNPSVTCLRVACPPSAAPAASVVLAPIGASFAGVRPNISVANRRSNSGRRELRQASHVVTRVPSARTNAPGSTNVGTRASS
jgi:hypothetical protein